MANQTPAAPSFFEAKLPPELRNIVYDLVASADEAHITSKPLRGKFIYCSYFLPTFCSDLTKAEYRPIIAHRMLYHQGDVKAVVQDFNFGNVSKYLRLREEGGTLGLLREGGGTRYLDINLVFSKDFDGEVEGALKWTRMAQRMAKKSGSQLRTTYKVREVVDSLAMRRFKDSLRFEEEVVEGESEWARILKALQDAWAPPFDTPRGSPDGYSWGEGSASFDENGDWIPEGEREERAESEPGGSPNVLPPDDMEEWGGDDFARELLGDDYDRTPEPQEEGDEED